MPVVTIQAKQKDDRTPEIIEGLIAEVRQVIAKRLDLPVSKVMVVYEEMAAGLFWDGESALPTQKKKPKK
jgi:phenylpyruvate tautomerase PptA (4-oxalocrotonate tautomerase family)